MTGVTWLACSEGEPPESDDWLSEHDRKRLGAMTYTKRYEESRLSRWTAQRAVALTAGFDDAPDAIGTVTVSNAPDGSPRATHPGASAVSISSTDRAGWAVSVVRQGAHRLGCDLELVEPRSAAFVRDYLTAREQATVEKAPLTSDIVVNLMWSAKESALKVLRTGLRRDTRTVEVELELGPEGWLELRVDPQDGRLFTGWWRRFGPFLLTVVCDTEFGPPTSLVEPTPLLTAEPLHTWMQRPKRGI